MKTYRNQYLGKSLMIFFNSIPILVMVGLIPLVQDDFILTLFYIAIIIVALMMKYKKGEATILLFGFFNMLLFEFIFIKTGVETFTRNSLLGLMPLWLPFLWGYGFIAIKRGIEILEN